MSSNETIEPSCGDTPPKHAGLLREELLVFRHLLGLGENPFQAQLGPALEDCSFKDVLFVSIDVGGIGALDATSNRPYLVGISILDTRLLQSYVTTSLGVTDTRSEHVNAQNLIKSYQLQVGQSDYLDSQSRRFVFGLTTQIEGKNVQSYFQRLVQDRSFVVLTHGGDYGGAECRYVDRLHLGKRPLCHLDVLKVVQYPLQTYYLYSLAKLLDALKLPWRDLHVAGNDARFALHALLMTAVRDWNFRDDRPKSKPTPYTRAVLSSLKAIATAWDIPGPDWSLGQPALSSLFEDHPPKEQEKPEPETKKAGKKRRPEKTPEEKAERRERKKLAKAKRRLKEARRPWWLFRLADDMLEDEETV